MTNSPSTPEQLTAAQCTALALELGSAARASTARRVLESIRSTPGHDSWIKGLYIDHLAALEKQGLIEYEPGLFTRHGSIRYRARPKNHDLSSDEINSQVTRT